MKQVGEDMRCPKCGRYGLRDTGKGVTCKICGYALTPGENDKFRLYRMLKEEGKGNRRT